MRGTVLCRKIPALGGALWLEAIFHRIKTGGLHISGISLPCMVTYVVELDSTTSPYTAVSSRGLLGRAVS